MREKSSESEYALAVGRSQRKIRGARADLQRFRAVSVMLSSTLGEAEIRNNNGWGTGEDRRELSGQKHCADHMR